jgi:hypothetical protein
MANRYLFRHEHEIPIDQGSKESVFHKASWGNALPYLLGMRDSIFQFELMTIKEDYNRVTEGGDHLTREKTRVKVLLKRLEVGLESTDLWKQEPATEKIKADFLLLVDQLKNIGTCKFQNLSF